MIMNYTYDNLLKDRPCSTCHSRNVCFLRQMPMQQYPESVQQFVITVPNAAFKQPQPLFGRKYWHADYHLVQDWLVQYYNRDNCGLPGSERNYLTNEEQRKCDEQRIKEQFKQLLDAAAKTTEDKNPRLFIMFDGIGLVLASDYLEAVSKIFSMFKKLGEINKDYTGACFGY